MIENKTLKFKPKYNLAIGYFIIGLIFLGASIFGKTTWASLVQEGKGAMVIYFGICFNVIVLPFAAASYKTSVFELNRHELRIYYLFGLVKRVIDLKGITEVEIMEMPITYNKDPRLMMGIKSIKRIIIKHENKKLLTIDGNTLQSKDFVLLKK